MLDIVEFQSALSLNTNTAGTRSSYEICRRICRTPCCWSPDLL